jgi:hypothetical protein
MLAFASLPESETADAGYPLTVLFARSLLDGATLFAISAAALTLASLATRPLFRKRR